MLCRKTSLTGLESIHNKFLYYYYYYFHSHGFSSLYIMNDCWSSYPIVFYFPKGDRKGLRKAFNGRIRMLRESGLVDRWLSLEIGREKTRRKDAMR